MATIDSSILLQGKGVQLNDPMEVQGRVMALRNLAMQQEANQQLMQDKQDERNQQRTLADLYKGAIDPTTGKMNRSQILSSAASSGLGHKIPDMQKQFTAEDNAVSEGKYKTAQTDELQFNTQKKKLELIGGTLNSLLSRPQVTHQDAIQALTSLVQQGAITSEQGAAAVRELPGNPAALRPFLMEKGMASMDASKRMELLTPKFEKLDTGSGIEMGTVNQMTGEYTPGKTVRKGVSPDAALREAGDERRSLRADARSAATQEQGKWSYDSTRGGLVNMKTGEFKPATTDGQPIGAAGATGTGARKQDANDAIALIDEAYKLLDGATGSYGGKAIDMGAQLFGAATPGSQKAARLKALEGMLVSKMPKMSGPQSDKDVAMYKQMAATVGDDTIPAANRKAALDTVREIQERYAGMPARPKGNMQGQSGTVGATPAAPRNIVVDF